MYMTNLPFPDHRHKNNGTEDGPVTVIVTRRAKREKIGEFEAWMDGIIHESMKFEGHLGVNIIRPSDPANPEYVIIIRFNSYENLLNWEKSEARKEWLRKSRGLTEGEPRREIQTGLEFWFTPLSRSQKESGELATLPPRYKMALVTGGIVFLLLITLIPQIRELTAGLPIWVSTLLGVAIMVLLMTYVIMPLVTRLLKPWLSNRRMF